MAAAIKEGHSGPIFIQGAHSQADAKKYTTDPQGVIDGLVLQAFGGWLQDASWVSVVRRLVDQLEARALVNPPRGMEDVVRPEDELAVAGGPREVDACVDELRADGVV